MNILKPLHYSSKKYNRIKGKHLLTLIGNPIIKEEEKTITLMDQHGLNTLLLTSINSRRGSSIDFTDIIKSMKNSEENLLKKHEKYVIRQENTLKLLFDLFINSTIIYSVITSLFYLAFIPQNILDHNIDIFV